MVDPNDATVVSVGFAIILDMISAAGLLYDCLHKNHEPHLWPEPAEHARAIATLRYYRDVQDSSDLVLDPLRSPGVAADSESAIMPRSVRSVSGGRRDSRGPSGWAIATTPQQTDRDVEVTCVVWIVVVLVAAGLIALA